MRPDCFGIMTLNASRVQKNVESRCVDNILCQSSSVFSCVGMTSLESCVLPIPALLISMSIVPNAATKSVNIFLTAALLETSATKDRALPPARSISVTTLLADSGLISLTPTFAPSRANVSPISRPSPEPPPVISTTLSLSFIATLFSTYFFPSLKGKGLLFAFLELPLPIEPARFRTGRLGFLYHAFLLIEHAEIGEREY